MLSWWSHAGTRCTYFTVQSMQKLHLRKQRILLPGNEIDRNVALCG
jgi:hypothetical protein